MPRYTVEVINPGFDADLAVVDAESPQEAALTWARQKGPEWWRAIPWNGRSPKDFRLLDVFVHADGRVPVEFAAVYNSGSFSVHQAP
jgi:hypothetical protein